MDTALDSLGTFRDRPDGTLQLNVPVSASRMVLPAILSGFLAAYTDIRLEITIEHIFGDVFVAGCDGGIRYDERLVLDMISVPIGPRVLRFAAAASPAYPIRRGPITTSTGAAGSRPFWVPNEPIGQLVTRAEQTTDLAIDMAVSRCGIVYIFENWICPNWIYRGL